MLNATTAVSSSPRPRRFRRARAYAAGTAAAMHSTVLRRLTASELKKNCANGCSLNTRA